ncbi:unnamed protein product [Rotaria sp. Silwood2]|nr:unnamed protein product [Rotaria sp. Silwood2]CAF3394048.1 unnamed protein product [Rotaria sp. Silwood2]
MLIWTIVIETSHFNGGTITWVPVYPNDTSSSILITITQSYSWVYPTVNCTTNIPTNAGSTNLICVANCSTDGGYTSHPISILTDCTSYSTSLNMTTSERSVNVTLNQGAYFWISNNGSAWRNLTNVATTNKPDWSIVSLIDLRRRPDGVINTPPVGEVTSPQYVVFNQTNSIKIYVSDVNIEDFINTTSNQPMSSVPVQFLIYVLPTPYCSQAPQILPLTGCFEVQVNVSVNFTLYTMNFCNRTKVTITDIIFTVDISGMQASSLVNSTTNTSLAYVTLNWTPQTNQIGSQQFCAVAYTSEKVQSSSYCAKFTVTTSKPCITTTTTTTTDITSTTSKTTTTTESTTTSATLETTTSATSETTTTTTSATSMTTTSTTLETTTATTSTQTTSTTTTTITTTTGITETSTTATTATTTTTTSITYVTENYSLIFFHNQSILILILIYTNINYFNLVT